MIPKTAVFLLLASWTTLCAAAQCMPTRYMDGDTFDAWINGKTVRVRVAGFDAPERGQAFANLATKKIREFTARGAECDCYKQDRYERSICTVKTATGENVATLMLKAGLGCIDARFERETNIFDRQSARAALKLAQMNRRGMWEELRPLCGYEYRQINK